MKHRNLVLFASAIVLAGSAALTVHLVKPAAPAPAQEFRSQLPLNEFMAHVFERNAEQLWAWTAEEIDAKGDHSGRPVNDKDWENAESDSLTLVELTYALEGSAVAGVKDPEWQPHIASLRSAANASAHAADKHDYPALQKASNDINAACVACHWRFAPVLEVVPKFPEGK